MSNHGHSLRCRQVREALDRGQPVPAEAGPHDVAATILAFFAALPAPFMPTSAAQVCDVCVPSVRIGVLSRPLDARLGRGAAQVCTRNEDGCTSHATSLLTQQSSFHDKAVLEHVGKTACQSRGMCLTHKQT